MVKCDYGRDFYEGIIVTLTFILEQAQGKAVGKGTAACARVQRGTVGEASEDKSCSEDILVGGVSRDVDIKGSDSLTTTDLTETGLG